MNHAIRKRVGWWLTIWAVMLLMTVVIGGLTRLTDAGLSITEWQPVTGVIPPLNEAAWQLEFEKYQRIPEYRLQNRGMTLAEFKPIYYWEYGHRLWARLVGLALALPLLWFWWRASLPGWLKARLLVMLTLTGLQAALGWYMVQSGLTVRTDVSQFRLAAHLGLALTLVAVTVWTAADLLMPSSPVFAGQRGLRRAVVGWTSVVVVTALAGTLVAGLDAGKVYNEFPLMGGRLVPAGYFAHDPWWASPGSNVIAVQFNHRLFAFATLVMGIWLAFRLRRPSLPAPIRRFGLPIGGVTAIQFGLGVATLLTSVRIPLAVLHQAAAVVLFALAIVLLHWLRPAGAGGRP
jgi:cytochrome c oxidase assembly protein subunit 15